MTFVANADGTVIVNGTATAETFYSLTSSLYLEAGTYYLDGVPVGESGASIRPCFYMRNMDSTYKNSIFIGGEVLNIATSENYSISIDIVAGNTLTNAVFKPMLVKGSEAVEYAPYSNIRPFIGYNKLDLHAAGKNLAPRLVPGTVNGVAFTVNEDGSVHVSGTASVETARFVDFYLPAGSYIISGAPAGSAFAKYDVYIVQMPETGDNGTVIGRSFDGSTVTHFTIDKYSRMRLVVRIPAGTVDSTKVFHPMIRLASITDAGYIPHNAKLHTVQIGQTVYDGKFDWLTGKLVAEWILAKGVFTRAALDSSGMLYAVAGIPSTAKPYTTTKEEGEPNIVCTALPFRALEDARKYGEVCISQYGTGIYIGGFVGREAELDALIASDDFAVAYKLATPIEIQLTPHIISAVEPEQTNTLYGDGSINVEYVKPLHVSIEERVAAAVAAAMQT